MKVAWLVARHPLFGGEYYRAARPAALASKWFGWDTAACSYMGTTEEEDGGPLSLVTANDYVITPDIIVVRPIQEWRQHWTDQAHANGQKIVADLDDDLWKHEKYEQLQDESPDHYNEWFWNVDAVMVSTRHMKNRMVEMGHKAPVFVAPNCYDPFGLNSSPRPGRVLGTRLWMSGRMEADLALYDTMILPLLEELDLAFLHVGAGEPYGRFLDRGWPEERLIEKKTVPIPLMPEAMRELNIGTICMADHPFNDAKTETHAVELASMGVPLVAASNYSRYRSIPGRVPVDKDAVRSRVEDLLDPYTWLVESEKARHWARQISFDSEQRYRKALEKCVATLT